MKISESKTYKILPASKTKVKTVLNNDIELPTGLVMKFYIDKRRSGNGVFLDMVSGSHGDWWWIQHDEDSSIGIYNVSEVFDR